MLTLIEQGEILTPRSIGIASLLIAGERVMRLGGLDPAALRRALPEDVRTIDARGCYVTPGLIDPHAHLIGAGGEQGFLTRQPEMNWEQIVAAGVTCVIGCLGTDAVTRHLSALLAKANELTARGLTALMYTGSFQVPPPTLTGSVTSDLVLIDKVIGAAEIAIADSRSSQPTVAELARVVADAYVGGTLSGKAGVTHFHVGPSDRRLSILHQLLDEHDIVARCLYPTHVTRTPELVEEAAALARRGAYMDTDTVEPGTAKWLRHYLECGGPPDRFTFSSDSHTPGGSPQRLWEEFIALVRDQGFSLEQALPYFTSNTAAALKLPHKGTIQPGADADLLLIDQKTLELRAVISRGSLLLSEGRIVRSRQAAEPLP